MKTLPLLAIFAALIPFRATADEIRGGGQMVLGTSQHAALMLPDGRILIVGGDRNSGGETIVQAYQPETNSWEKLGDLLEPRFVVSANLLANGEIYVAGGFSNSGKFLGTAELFSPSTGTSVAAPKLVENRDNQRTESLPDGRIFMEGGDNEQDGYVDSSEFFDPEKSENIEGPTFPVGRSMDTVTKLTDGRLLISGGIATAGEDLNYLDSAFVLGSDGKLQEVGKLHEGRKQHTATRLLDGRVLIAGGEGKSGPLANIEIFDPKENAFSSGPELKLARYGHTATLLRSGRVLITGGATPSGITRTTEIYDPATNSVSDGPEMKYPRILHSANALSSGNVVLSGGYYKEDSYIYPNDAELFLENRD